jgi:hypothetical protein
MKEMKFSFQSRANKLQSIWNDVLKSALEFGDSDIVVTLTKKRKSVSKEQRGYWWGCIIPNYQKCILAEWGEHISKEEAHDTLKKECNYKELVNEQTGKVLRIVLSTEGIDTFKREEIHEKARKFMFEKFNYICPLPNEQLEI